MKQDITEKIDLYTEYNVINNDSDDNLNENSEDQNPKFLFTSTNTKLLLKIAIGKINCQEYAKRELVNRGFGSKGEWIGFKEAENYWKPKVK